MVSVAVGEAVICHGRREVVTFYLTARERSVRAIGVDWPTSIRSQGSLPAVMTIPKPEPQVVRTSAYSV